MAQRKYVSEFALSVDSQWVFLIEYGNLERLSALSPPMPPCHIYMICRRPRIAIDRGDFLVDEASVRGTLLVQRGNEHERHPFSMRNLMGRADLRLEAPYPHTHFALISDAGERVSWGKVGLLAHYAPGLGSLLDLEVMYVGQAFGENGSRTAPDRLKSHSTLLAIYAEAVSRSPDQEIYLVLLNFNYFKIASFDGRAGAVETTDEQDRQHIDEVMDADLNEQFWINFAEAALIRYFQPDYNTMFKGTFPSPAHGSYRECYDIDINTLAVGIDTSELHAKLWSPSAPASYWHTPHFELHSREERMSMLDI